MKVLQLGKFYPPYRGGMESHLQTLCQQLIRQAEVEVLVSNTNAKTVSCLVDGVPVTRIGRVAHLASTSFCPRMAQRIRESRADVVHFHWPNPSAALALLASGYRGKLVITYHSDVIRQRALGKLFAPLLDSLLRACNTIIASSPNYIASSQVLWKYAGLCRVIPFGISDVCFEQPSRDSVMRIRREHGDKIVLSVGRLVPYKGFEYLIRAMSSVGAKLLIAGDGPLRERLIRLRNDLKLSDRVIFLGNPSNEELRACYRAADVFAFSSVARSEAFGIVQAEAMAAGTPVENTNLRSGVPFVSQHGVTGLTVEPRNPQALSEALTTLLENPQLRHMYGVAARRRAETTFTVQSMMEKTLAVYSHVLRSRDPELRHSVFVRPAVAAR
jgi:glycosyltransferase involved in cell wall biosynthesis